MSSSEEEGAENTDEDLSSSDLDSTDNEDNENEEESPLQKDVHQQNLIAIHLTDQMKKKDGEVHGLRYMIVGDNELDDWHEEDASDDDDEDNKKYKKIYNQNKNQKMVMFPLYNYTVNETVMLLLYLLSAVCIFILIIIIPIIQKIVTIINLILVIFAVIFASVGIFFDGKFYLMFNYEEKEIYIQQKMCCGCYIYGNKGFQGRLLGKFSSFVSAKKVKINDIIGEGTWERWQFILTFHDEENGESCEVIFTTTNEDRIDEMEYNVNKWWEAYKQSDGKKC